jgi:hypothetical protein
MIISHYDKYGILQSTKIAKAYCFKWIKLKFPAAEITVAKKTTKFTKTIPKFTKKSSLCQKT